MNKKKNIRYTEELWRCNFNHIRVYFPFFFSGIFYYNDTEKIQAFLRNLSPYFRGVCTTLYSQ